MFVVNFDPSLTKPEFYAELQAQIRLIIGGQQNWVTNLSNAASLIYHGLNCVLGPKYGSSVDAAAAPTPQLVVNWAGFYLTDSRHPDTLFLGPFHGRVACTLIKYGRGVCGTAAARQETQLVPNVHDFPGHIACDAETKSEIVVPLKVTTAKEGGGAVLGVLDLDALHVGVFDEEDRKGLEEIARILVEGCDWSYPKI